MQIVLFGPPGAGKGTQAKLLSSNLSIPHLSTGEILRSKLKDQDELALELNKIMTTGNLVSDDILNQIVSEHLLSNQCHNGFILDGYPRTMDQSKFFINFINKNLIKVSKIINLFLDDKKIKSRILSRSKIENRDDDNLEIIINRIEAYNKETRPVVEFYKKEYSENFYEINGNQNIEKIQLELLNIAKND